MASFSFPDATAQRRCPINNRFHMLHIRTPEGVVFSLMLAGPVVRMLAWMIDAAIIGIIASVVQTLLAMAFMIRSGFVMALAILVIFAITVGYGIFFEWNWNGQTPGKRLLRLRVVDESGRRLQFGQVVVRNLLRFVDSLPAFYLVGGAASVISSRTQRLGDLAAGTLVVRIPEIGTPDVEEISGGKYNSFNDYPYLEARLRSLVSSREASLALSALVRRNELDDVSRVRVFRTLADQFHQLVQFPAEVVEEISDEQFVRNVVCSVYKAANSNRGN